jgi:hypothetical protein
VDRFIEIVRANPAQFFAIGALIAVVVVAWIVESSAWRSHR